MRRSIPFSMVMLIPLFAHADHTTFGHAGRRPQEVISVSDMNACALTRNGKAMCWGDNNFGQIGNGSASQLILPPSMVSGLDGVVAIASGRAISCAIVANGEVKCWGLNRAGWVGDNTTTDRFTPVNVMGPLPFSSTKLSGAKAIAVGDAHACAVMASGSVYCWGDNSHGQLGDGTNTRRLLATKVSSSYQFSDVSLGDRHSCALRSNGEVWCWGANQENQLETGTGADSKLPVLIRGFFGVKALSVGSTHACAVFGDGRVGCFGSLKHQGWPDCGAGKDKSRPNEYRCIGDRKKFDGSDLSQVKAIACGGNFSCALSADGKVWCWGGNVNEVLGTNASVQMERQENFAATAQDPDNDPARPYPLRVDEAVAISAGKNDVCIVTAAGQVKCWGRNVRGEAGDVSANVVPSYAPRAISLAGAKAATTGPLVAAGMDAFSCASRDGETTLRCFGNGAVGQLARGTSASSTSPVPSSSFDEVPLQIGAGEGFGCALGSDGRAQCWGAGASGALGNGFSGTRIPPSAAVRSAGGNVDLDGLIGLSVGKRFAIAVKGDGRAYTWGDNSLRQLGNGSSTASSMYATAVSWAGGGDFHDVIAVAAGAAHACALVSDGSLWCWGNNGNGQLGDDTTVTRANPVQVLSAPGVPLTHVIDVSAGLAHTCALLGTGQVRCWGAGARGQLGAGALAASRLPVAITDTGCAHATTLTGAALSPTCNTIAASVCANDPYCCATAWDGTCVNEVGTLSANRASAISVGGTSSCAVFGSGGLSCWGANDSGQLGDGTTVDKRYAQQAWPLQGVNSAASGVSFSLAVQCSGKVNAWGANGSGQLGIGSIAPSLTPVHPGPGSLVW